MFAEERADPAFFTAGFPLDRGRERAFPVE
jgi:hypothetical protein